MNVEEIYSQTRCALEALLKENRPFFNPVRLLVVGGMSLLVMWILGML